MSTWTHNMCYACWRSRNGDRVPVQFKDPPPATCCYCGSYTDVGIYVRENPRVVKHCRCEESK